MNDPAAPLFAASLLPYLLFLWWAKRSGRFPLLALWGFGLTLLFVVVTIGAAAIAQIRYGAELANVDWLHGGAEAFLSISNLVLLLGFSSEQVLRPTAQIPSGLDDHNAASRPSNR
jgi:hypothetical protein